MALEPRNFGSYDIVIVGSGFASSFLLKGLSNTRGRPLRTLVLEAGPKIMHSQRLQERRLVHLESGKFFDNATPSKPWFFSRIHGGGSNCWFGTTPRMLPEDFKMRTNYGIGSDWPISYGELEPYYSEAEGIMDISGPKEAMPYWMSKAYPQPPHRFSDVDLVMKRAFPDLFFNVPTARSRTSEGRAACCNNGVCSLCPINAKFTVENGFPGMYSLQRGVHLLTEAPVVRLEAAGNSIKETIFRVQGEECSVRSSVVVMGANAIFNPFILLRSGFQSPGIGEGLCEQVGVSVFVELRGMKNFQGSTITTGLGFNGLSGEHRRQRAGFLYHTANRAMNISTQRGKTLSIYELIVNIEDLRKAENRVVFDKANPERPRTFYSGHSRYAQTTVEALPTLLKDVLSPLPVESISMKMRSTESHIQCTTVMGNDPNESVVDKNCIHHRFRNLVLLGSGTFPTASPANPTLTVCALALRAADFLAKGI